ncbi:hypothetical protein ACFQER_08265 [Halomicroarcula sp. GCM10025894]|uniref:hypothetical protein n=1 Tax=Halomicroarcula sp. GCM10025894 TaxID=3252673 RepID=UPI00361AE954
MGSQGGRGDRCRRPAATAHARRAGADRLYGAIERAVSRGGVDRVAMLVDVEHPLGDALHDAVVRGARAAAASGVTEWRVVAEYECKATAVARALPAVDAAVVVDDRSIRAQPA